MIGLDHQCAIQSFKFLSVLTQYRHGLFMNLGIVLTYETFLPKKRKKQMKHPGSFSSDCVEEKNNRKGWMDGWAHAKTRSHISILSMF